jgi:prevent-host-death family protein
VTWSGRSVAPYVGGMTHVDVQEAKTRLSQLLAAAERGEEVVIARGGRPVVRLVPVGDPQPRPVGFVAGAVPETFFEPLPDDELARWE